MSKLELMSCAMAMIDRDQQAKNRRLKLMAVAFAVVPVALVAQGLRMRDGTNLIVELDAPQAIFAVMRRDRDSIEVKSLHLT